MKIIEIECLNFRNYKTLKLDLRNEKKINILKAQNGKGKTNIIELIFFLSYYRSFRNVKQKELINIDTDHCLIKCNYLKKGIINNKIIKIEKNKKEIINNNKKIYKISESFADIISVLFCNEDNNLINGNLNIRRKFFDMFISILDKNYLLLLKKYYLLIKQKNFLLKNSKNLELLNIYDKQLSEVIFYIKEKRLEIIKNINKIFSEKYEQLGNFNQKVSIFYDSKFKNFDNTEYIYNFLKNNREQDIKARYTFYGTHKDNYFFFINNKPFEKYASLGQIRLAALILKLIQAYYINNIFKESPIILIDDVILELDIKRQKNFIKEILIYEQIFITISDDKYFSLFNDINETKNIIEIDYGKIQRIFSY